MAVSLCHDGWMRDVIVAANWKMHTTPSDAGDLATTIAARTRVAGVSRVICPPFVSLAVVRDALAASDPDVGVGAQNVHHELQGAYTGEVAAPMLVGLATWVIVGHSERRRDAAETDELIGRKLGRAIDAGLRPILCVGERLEEREADGQDAVVHAAARGRRWPDTIRPPSPRRPGHRLRTGLGDRHRPERDVARCRCHGRTDPRIAAAPAAGAPPRPTSRSSTAAASRPANFGEFMAEPRSTVRSSAARRSRSTRWHRSWRVPGSTARARRAARPA